MRDNITYIQNYLTNFDDEKLAEHVFWIDWCEDNADISIIAKNY